MGWVLIDVCAEILYGMEGKVVCNCKLAVDLIGSVIQEFVNCMDEQAFLKRKLVEFGVIRYW